MSLLGELLACIYAEYWSDETKAGVVLSQLAGTGDFYRYPGGPNNKQIVRKAKGKTFDEAVRGLVISWLLETRRFESLRASISRPNTFDALLGRTLRGSR